MRRIMPQPARARANAASRSNSLIRNEVAKPERIPADDFTEGKSYRRAEHRSIENEGVELAVFSAGIDIGRQPREEVLIDHASDEGGIELSRIDANDGRLESR